MVNKFYPRRIRLITFISIILMIPALFYLFIFIQKLLYQKQGEVLFSSGFLLVFAIMLAILIPIAVIFTIFRKHPEFKREFSRTGFKIKSIKRFCIFFIIFTMFFIFLTVFTMHNYIKLGNDYAVVSEFSLFSNEKTYSYLDIKESQYVYGCQYFDTIFYYPFCLESQIEKRLPELFKSGEETSAVGKISSFCEKGNIPNYTAELIKLNLWGLIILGLASLFAYVIVSGKSPIKKVSERAKKIIKILVLLMPIGSLIFVNIPILQDTFFVDSPLEITGAAEFAGRVSGPGTIIPPTIYQRITLTNGITYSAHFNPNVLHRGETYKLCYLPNSRTIVRIESLEKPRTLE